MNSSSPVNGNPVNRSVVVMILVLAALFGCSASLGDIPVDLPAEGVSEPVACAPVDDLRFVNRCPLTPYVTGVTALQAFSALRAVASAALGVEILWAGRIAGVGIARDGRSTGAPLSGWTVSWAGGDPADPDMLVLDTSGSNCMVQNRCSCVSNNTCPGWSADNIDSVVEPPVDSAVAIAGAFPDDPADSLYDLVYDGFSGVWAVSPAASIPVVPDIEVPDVLHSDADALNRDGEVIEEI